MVEANLTEPRSYSSGHYASLEMIRFSNIYLKRKYLLSIK